MKQMNTGGKPWWARWNRESGYQRVLFRNRGVHVPGIDFRVITRAEARGNPATRALVEAYSRKRLRDFIDQFGFRNDLQDLVFEDLTKNPPREFSRGRELPDGTIAEETETAPGTITIRLRQVVERGAKAIPLSIGGVTLVLTEDNELLAISSHYVPDASVSPGPEIDPADAIQSALLALGTAESEIEEGPTASLFAVPVGGTYEVAWVVAFESDVPETAASWWVEIAARDGSVILADNTTSYANYTRQSPARVLDQDQLDLLLGCSDCFDQYADAVSSADLLFLDESRSDLHGKYARITNIERENAEPDSVGQYRFDAVQGAFDCVDAGGVGGASCAAIFSREEESHHDEVLAYHHLTTYAGRLSSLYDGWELNRATNTNPGIPVRVNHGTEWSNSAFTKTCSSPNIFSSTTCTAKLKFGDGDIWRIVANDHSLNGGPPIDFLVRKDYSKEADIAIHEFGHAVLWDKGISTTGGRFTDAVHEGHADFFAVDVRNNPLYASWTEDSRNLEPASDDAYPQDLDKTSPFSEHQDGQIWGGSWWDLRKRGVEIEEAGVGVAPDFAPEASREISALAFYFADYAPWSFDYELRITASGDPTLEPCVDCGFIMALAAVLETDDVRFGSRYTYEILAAFARHGIQLEDPLSVITAEELVIDATVSSPNVPLRVFLGTNDFYAAIVSPFPSVVRSEAPAVFNPDLPGFNALIVFNDLGAGGAVQPLLPDSPAGTQNTALITLPGALVERLAQLSGRNPAPMYMRAFTSSDSEDSDDRDSYIPGAGEFMHDGDLPFFLYVLPTSGGGCVCQMDPRGHSSSLLPLIFVLAGAGLARRWAASRS